MRILLTGCAGYLGSTLCQNLLRAGFDVIGLDRLMFNNSRALLGLLGHPKFEFFEVDVREKELVKHFVRSCDAIIPLAALVGAPICERNPKEAREVNYEVVRDIVGVASPRQTILFPNTNSGYGQTTGDEEVTEEWPLVPISVYGITKCEAEKVVLDHPRGISFRLATVFGTSPRMRFDLLVNDWTERLCYWKVAYGGAEGLIPCAFSVYEPNFHRNFVHVRDVARAFTFAAAEGIREGAYNLGLPTANLSKMELAHLICDRLDVTRQAVAIGPGKDPDRRNYIVSNKKILQAGFRFNFDLGPGVSEVAQLCSLLSGEETKGMRNA